MLKITTLTVVLLLLLTIPVQAGIQENWNNWSQQDTELQWVSTSFIVFDMWQTDVGIKNGAIENGWVTMFFGEHPSTEQLIAYGIGDIVLNYCIIRAISPRYRKYFQITTIGIEYDCISKSYGTKIMFHIPI